MSIEISMSINKNTLRENIQDKAQRGKSIGWKTEESIRNMVNAGERFNLRLIKVLEELMKKVDMLFEKITENVFKLLPFGHIFKKYYKVRVR